jgi:AraC-like DNA-binding protein
MQQHFTPPKTLQLEVKCLWVLEEAKADFNADLIFPDSHTELIINCGAPLMMVTDSGEHTRIPDTFLNRLLQKPVRLYAVDEPRLIAVRLYPWVARTFIDPLTDLSASTNIIPLSAFWQETTQRIRRIFQRVGQLEAIADLTQILLDSPRQKTDLTAIHNAGERLYHARGQLRISDLAAESYLSVSQFERRFKHFTGVSAKTYARLTRFEYIRDYLWLHPECRIVDVVQEFGFTDQAHFIHEFKSLTASTPGVFAAHIRARKSKLEPVDFYSYSQDLCTDDPF